MNRESVDNKATKQIEAISAASKEKRKKLKNAIKKLEQSLGQKISGEKLEEYKSRTEGFITSVSDDISSFNRLIHSFEDKIASMGKYINEFKKQQEKPKVVMQFKDEISGKADKEILSAIDKFNTDLKVLFHSPP